jgi:hypothetical protein
LGLGLAVWGAWTAWTMARAIRPLSGGENPPAWKHMYLMMLTLQVGVALAYVIG